MCILRKICNKHNFRGKKKNTPKELFYYFFFEIKKRFRFHGDLFIYTLENDRCCRHVRQVSREILIIVFLGNSTEDDLPA